MYKGLPLHSATYIAPVCACTGSQLTPAQTRLSPAVLTDPSQVPDTWRTATVEQASHTHWHFCKDLWVNPPLLDWYHQLNPRP